MPNSSLNSPSRSAPAGPRRWGCVAAIAALVTLGVVAGATILKIRSHGMPPLDSRRLEQGWLLWKQSGPQSYDIEVQVAGRQGASYRVEVRQGEIARALRNGQPLKQPRTLGTWSVPGMFETIEIDLEQQERARRGIADRAVPGLSLFAQLDAQFGFPRRYLRLEHAGMGTNPEVSWEVSEFTVR